MSRTSAMHAVVNGVEFTYEGGAFVEVRRPGALSPFTSIPVWDYEQGRPRIGSEADFRAVCGEWREREAARPPVPGDARPQLGSDSRAV